jgi:hypothetical protein
LTVTIAESERDNRLAEKLLADLPGILRCAVEGCLAWYQEGLQPPLAVRLATDDYHAETDVITAFLLERCVKGPDKQRSKADLYADYAGWSTLRGVLAGTPKAFGSHSWNGGLRMIAPAACTSGSALHCEKTLKGRAVTRDPSDMRFGNPLICLPL